jgi:Nuclease-related domain
MIVKERLSNEHDDTDANSAAGARAEAQMAFYLKRAFGDAKDVLVLHDLRLPSKDGSDAAQIDHLVLHTGGMVIVESKSVTSEVSVNENHEFSRLWNGRWQGFKSPIQQSKLQADFLQKALAEKRVELRDKALFGLLQKGFGMVPFDILVAISDTGIIHRKADVPEVLKADQVVDRIREIMGRRCVSFARYAVKSKNDNDPWDSFTASEMKRIADYLVASHRPVSRKVAAPVVVEIPAAQPAPPAPSRLVPAVAAAATAPALASAAPQVLLATAETRPACRHCASPSVAVTHGKFGYYLKCTACAQNTKIDFTCSKCGKEGRIRKDKLVFHRECTCGHSEVYHVNEAG